MSIEGNALPHLADLHLRRSETSKVQSEADWYRNASDSAIEAALQAVFVDGYKRGVDAAVGEDGT